MIFLLIAFVVGLVLAWWAYTHVPPAPAQISEPVAAYDNQYELFRDMEPVDQTRENSWIGFLQENVRTGRTGPIGDFIGNESNSGNAPLYSIEAIQEPTPIEVTKAAEGQPTSKVVMMNSITGTEIEYLPGTYTINATSSTMRVYPPLLVVVKNTTTGVSQTTRYVAGNAPSKLTLDPSYSFNQMILSIP